MLFIPNTKYNVDANDPNIEDNVYAFCPQYFGCKMTKQVVKNCALRSN